MNENLILMLVNDDIEINEILEMGFTKSTAYLYFKRKQALIDSYEKAHKKLAKIRLKARAKQ